MASQDNRIKILANRNVKSIDPFGLKEQIGHSENLFLFKVHRERERERMDLFVQQSRDNSAS